MSGKRGYSIFEQISLMSKRGKITLASIATIIVVTIFTCTYFCLAKDNGHEEEIIKDEPVGVAVSEEAVERVDEIPEEQPPVVEEEEKVVFEEKEVVIPKAKVAKANSKEDSQKKKTGGDKISAEDAVAKFENDGQSVGIDVSKHQGKIDWSAVKASGVEFAMIRCGFRGNSAGEIYEDTYFRSNINGAVNNGILVGIYFYSTAINEAEALQEAAWVVNTIKSYRVTYPVVYDFEDFGVNRTAGVSREQATSNAITFLNYVASAGYTPMMYASKNDITNNFNKSRLSGYKFWLAHYTSATNYTGSYQMWQYTSQGSVAGISGGVDMNIAYFRYGAVAEPKHTHDFEHGTEISTNESRPATCYQTGIKFIRCASCSECKRVEIPKNDNHTLKLNEEGCIEATCEKKGVKSYKCEFCDFVKVEETEFAEHKYGDWVITTPPTEESEGEKTRYCEVCKHEDKDKVDKLTSKPEDNSTDPDKEDNTNTNTNTDAGEKEEEGNNTAKQSGEN